MFRPKDVVIKNVAKSDSVTKEFECRDCHKPIGENDNPCPFCGSDKRLIKININEKITMLESLKMKHKDKSGFTLGTTVVRDKIAGASKKRAKETLSYDRSNPDITKKLHHVEEIGEDDERVVVHHEEESYPAKKRPNKRPVA